MLELGKCFKKGSEENSQTQWTTDPVSLYSAISMSTDRTLPEVKNMLLDKFFNSSCHYLKSRQ